MGCCGFTLRAKPLPTKDATVAVVTVASASWNQSIITINLTASSKYWRRTSLIYYPWTTATISKHQLSGRFLLRVSGVCTCWTELHFWWNSLISRYIPALSRCHLSHSGPAPRCQQHHLSPRQKSERTHLENLPLRTFSRAAFTSQRAETGSSSWPGEGKKNKSNILLHLFLAELLWSIFHPGFICQIKHWVRDKALKGLACV